MSKKHLFIAALILGVGAGCKKSDTTEGSKAEESNKTQEGAQAAEDGKLVVYSGRKEALVGPLFEAFEKESGVDVEVRYLGTPELAAQLLTEGEQTEADVFYAQESGYLGAMGKAGLLAELPEDLINTVGEGYRGPNNHWVGISGRARVLVHDPKAIPADQMPKTLEELADPKFAGKVGWAPGNGSLHAHISALRHLWGEEKTEAWLKRFQALNPKRYENNSSQVQAVADGEIAIGWVNHYYLHKLGLGDKAHNYSFPEQGPGNLMMVSGAGILKASKRQDTARKLLTFLLSEQAQKHLAKDNFEYAARPGVESAEGVPAGDSLKAVDVDQTHLTDIGKTIEMLRGLGIE